MQLLLSLSLTLRHTSSPSSLATLTCEEEVLTFDCCVDEAIAKVAAVSEDGVLFLYQFSLSQTPSPLSATSTIRFVTSPPKVWIRQIMPQHANG